MKVKPNSATCRACETFDADAFIQKALPCFGCVYDKSGGSICWSCTRNPQHADRFVQKQEYKVPE